MTLELADERRSSDGRTMRFVWRLHDGALVESVVVHHAARTTVCVSSQVGCAMACSFCATGQGGYTRNLASEEIVAQVVEAQRRFGDVKKTNVVFMGMGEPLANFDQVRRSLEALSIEAGVSHRRITISTVGIVPGIYRLAEEPRPVRLAVSLHAANDDLRNKLIPLNKRYPLNDLRSACLHYVNTTSQRLSLEWVLIAGVNDRESDAAELTDWALGLGAHVNVIPLNATPGFGGAAPGKRAVRAFCEELRSRGVACTERRNRGDDISAACGQLSQIGRRNEMTREPPPQTSWPWPRN